MSYNIIGAPSRYIQGRGALEDINKHTTPYGKRFLLLTDEIVYNLIGDPIKDSITSEDGEIIWVEFNGESSMEEIDRVKAIFKSEKCDAVIGAGGGKALDTAKAVGYYINAPVIIIPTIASTDAPCSSLAVIYQKNALPLDLFLRQNPNLVLVDLDVISKAPVRTLVAGMGDAFATYYEARACRQSNAITMLQGLGTNSAFALAKLSNEILLEDGLKARVAVENGTVTKALENIIETNIYLSGVGFENNGCAVAHGFYNGISSLPRAHKFMHGECVAFGTLVQLVLENVPMVELQRVQKFYFDVGLPMTLAELGLSDLAEAELKEAVKASIKNEITHNMPFAVTEERFLDAVVNADRLGERFLS